MFLPHVGKNAVYSGQYHHHWEAGTGITVCVLPVPKLAIGSVVLVITGLGYWFEAVSWTPACFAAGVVVLWIWGAAFERWLPSSLPDESKCKAASGVLRCEVKFEAIVGPRRTIIDRFGHRWDREVRIIQYLAANPADSGAALV